MTEHPVAPLLNAKEVAAQLGCSRQHVYTVTEKGHLLFVNIGSGDKRALMRWRQWDVSALVTSRLSAPPEEAIPWTAKRNRRRTRRRQEAGSAPRSRR